MGHEEVVDLLELGDVVHCGGGRGGSCWCGEVLRELGGDVIGGMVDCHGW